MERNYQAKDVQEIIGIPKHRYEYLASKIGINPDFKSADGQGTVKRYSFNNLLQFAYAHSAGGLGLSPESIRIKLSWLDEFQKKYKIYESDAPLSVHFVCIDNFRYYLLTGDALPIKREKSIHPMDFTRLAEAFEKIKKGVKGGDRLVDIIKTKKIYTKQGLKFSDGYLTINLGVIRARIINEIER